MVLVLRSPREVGREEEEVRPLPSWLGRPAATNSQAFLLGYGPGHSDSGPLGEHLEGQMSVQGLPLLDRFPGGPSERGPDAREGARPQGRARRHSLAVRTELRASILLSRARCSD